MNERDRLLAEKVRARCVAVAQAAYENAGLSGLCAEGRWELALDAIRSLDFDSNFLGGGESDSTATKNL